MAITLAIELKTPKNYTLITEVETKSVICPYTPDQADDGGAKASVKLGYLAPQCKTVIFAQCLRMMQRVTEIVYDPNSPTYEDGEPKEKLQEYSFAITLVADKASFGSDVLAEAKQSIQMTTRHVVNNEAAVALFDEVQQTVHDQLTLLFQANGVVPVEPPTVPLEQAEVLMEAQKQARLAQTAVESLASLRRAREHYQEYAKSMREEIAKADAADLERLSTLGVDFGAVQKALDVEIERVGECLHEVAGDAEEPEGHCEPEGEE